MSSIVVVSPPPTRRSSGRKHRLTEEEFKDLAEAIKAGNWASDDKVVPNHSGAYQRGDSARKVLGREFGLDADQLVVAVIPTEDNPQAEKGKGFLWRLGPMPEGQTRQRRTRKSDGASQSD